MTENKEIQKSSALEVFEEAPNGAVSHWRISDPSHTGAETG